MDNLLRALTDVKVAVFDVDGTLAREDSRISARTYEALTRLDASGVHVVVATGRAVSEVRRILTCSAVSYGAAANGTVVLDGSGGIIESTPIGRDLFERVRSCADRHGIPLILFSEDGMSMEEDGPARRRLTEINSGAVPALVDFDAVDPDEFSKGLFWVPEDDGGAVERAIREEFPDTVKTLPHHLEITREGVTKWTALQSIMAREGITPDQVMGVGDSENDLSWLPRIGVPVAVDNAYPHVKEQCRFVIGSNDADAVADLIDAWIAIR